MKKTEADYEILLKIISRIAQPFQYSDVQEEAQLFKYAANSCQGCTQELFEEALQTLEKYSFLTGRINGWAYQTNNILLKDNLRVPRMSINDIGTWMESVKLKQPQPIVNQQVEEL